MTWKTEIYAAWQRGGPFDEVLTQFVAATKSQAAGIWKIEDNHLVLAGIGWGDHVDDDAKAGFAAATARVSLEQTTLGIVQAVVFNRPTIARRDPQETGLTGSAMWLVRLNAHTSLAVPIRASESGPFLGAIAVATADFIEAGDANWQTIVDLAAGLSASTDEKGAI